MASSARDFIVVIPARLQASRLPRKPLLDIGGKPMIVHTYERAVDVCPAEKVFVATDSEEIEAACAPYGIQTLMTSQHCLTGTDRVAEVANTIEAEIYINLQGDEPFMPASNIAAVIEAGLVDKDQVINGWCHIKSEQEFRSLSVPKLVLREDGQLLYMSRAPIPGNKQSMFRFGRRQVCIYSFPKTLLQAFAARDQKTEHEQLEDIEILRFLEMGYEVKMIALSGDFVSVDTPEDIQKVRDHYGKQFV